MSFTEEFKQAKETKTFNESEAPAEAAAPEEIFNQGLPEGAAPVVPSEPAKPAVETPKIRIGTKEFTTPEEAYAYAQELEIARAQDQGFIEGVKASKPQVETPVEIMKSLEERVEEIIFERPKDAVALLIQEITANLTKQYQTDLTDRERQQAGALRLKQEWQNFYEQNKDLAGQEDYVNYILTKNQAEIGPMPVDKAFPALAEKVRESLRSVRASGGKVTELPAGPAAVASGGKGSKAPVATAPEPEEIIDFLAQLKKHSRRS